MQIRIYKDGEPRGPFTDKEVARFIRNGAYSGHDLGWTEQNRKWRPLAEILDEIQETPVVSVRSSAVKAGWICLAIGGCTFWLFGLGFAFFGATTILAIVAMSTNQIKQGIALLASAIMCIAVCWLISFFLVLGTAASTFNKITERTQSSAPQNIQAAAAAPQLISSSTPSIPPPIQPQRQVACQPPQTTSNEQQFQDEQRAYQQAENERLQRLQDVQMANAHEEDAKREQKKRELDDQMRYDQLKRDWENKYHHPYPWPPPY